MSGTTRRLPISEVVDVGLPKNLRIISSQGIRTSEGYKVIFISHCHDDNGGYAELNLKEDKTGWQKDELVERVYVKYDFKKNLQLVNILSLTKEIRSSRLWQVMFVSLTRLTKNSPLHRKSYSDGNLDLDILGYNMSMVNPYNAYQGAMKL